MKLKIDIVVEARTASERLPGKVTMKILNRTVLDLMIERLKKINNINDIIIATTVNKNDDVIEEIAIKNNVKFFRGSELDVLGRVTAAVKKFKTEIVVQITGDSPLIDKGISEEMITFFINNYEKYDFVSNDAGFYNKKYSQEYPAGLTLKVFKSSLLKKIEKTTKNPVDREHVVNYILKNPDQFKIFSYKATRQFYRTDLRLTLDYLEDFNLIKSIFENLYPKNKDFQLADILNFLDNNPEIKKLNYGRHQKEYNY
jgi:spore coat polysaccharide biosynthesis protein SpsF